MKTVHVTSSRDGDTLQVNESPWFRVAVRTLVGWYNPRWGFDYRAWSAILNWADKREQLLVNIPVAHSCDVAEKLWGNTNCWHGADDAT